jgi:hypothetical protein
MNKETEQALRAYRAIIQIRKNLRKIIGGDFLNEDEETGVYWLGAGVSLKNAGKPETVPSGESVKRRGLLNYSKGDRPLDRGIV